MPKESSKMPLDRWVWRTSLLEVSGSDNPTYPEVYERVTPEKVEEVVQQGLLAWPDIAAYCGVYFALLQFEVTTNNDYKRQLELAWLRGRAKKKIEAESLSWELARTGHPTALTHLYKRYLAVDNGEVTEQEKMERAEEKPQTTPNFQQNIILQNLPLDPKEQRREFLARLKSYEETPETDASSPLMRIDA